MRMVMELNECMNRFRLANRELFNHYFKVPREPSNYKYEFYDGFNAVQEILFQTLVLEPCAIPTMDEKYRYGIGAHPSIRVQLPNPNAADNVIGSEPLFAPIMLNRHLDSGYWDYSVDRFTNDATLLLIDYFDWESMYSRDNSLVRVQVSDWPQYPETVGKQGLVESYLVRYALLSA